MRWRLWQENGLYYFKLMTEEGGVIVKSTRTYTDKSEALADLALISFPVDDATE